MDLKLSGRRALVTGASQGLGRAVAAALATEGAKVAICGRDAARIEAARDQIGAKAGLVAELGQPGAVDTLLAASHDALGGAPEVLVINTGGPPAAGFDAVSDDQWRQSFEDLWISSVQLIRGALPAMRQAGWGRVLMVTSISAREPLPDLLLSNALRPGLHGLLNALSREYGADGITFNALMPGYTLTERLREMGLDDAAVSATIPARRMGRPEELGALGAFLASELAGYVTGQAIACDGGYLRGI